MIIKKILILPPQVLSTYINCHQARKFWPGFRGFSVHGLRDSSQMGLRRWRGEQFETCRYNRPDVFRPEFFYPLIRPVWGVGYARGQYRYKYSVTSGGERIFPSFIPAKSHGAREKNKPNSMFYKRVDSRIGRK